MGEAYAALMILLAAAAARVDIWLLIDNLSVQNKINEIMHGNGQSQDSASAYSNALQLPVKAVPTTAAGSLPMANATTGHPTRATNPPKPGVK